MDRRGHERFGRRAARRRAPGRLELLITAFVLALSTTGSAQITLMSGSLPKETGFTITPPFQRSKPYKMMCGYGGLTSVPGTLCSSAHRNGSNTKDYYALDFEMPLNEPVHPAAPGLVVIANHSTTANPYGKFILIRHVNDYYSVYAHLNIVSVNVNDWVDVDAPIGRSGNTGSGSNGVYHLHFALYKGPLSITGSASYSGGTAVVPEIFSGCTKTATSGSTGHSDCEDIANGNMLRRDDFAPDVAVNSLGLVELVTCGRNPTGSARNLMYWNGVWDNLGGSCGSSPTAVLDAYGNLFVFVRGLAGELWFKYRPANGSWSGWVSPIGSVVGRPAAALDTRYGVVRVFVRRTPDQSVWVASQQSIGSSSFTSWQPLGGSLANSPVAARRADGLVEVYAAATNYTLWKIPGNGDGTFTTEYWWPQNVEVEAEPYPVKQGALEWVARSTSNQLMYQSTAVTTATHRPAVARDVNGRLYMFVRNRSTSAADYLYPSNGWWTWSTFGGVVTSELAAIRTGYGSGRIRMFTWGTGGLYYREQSRTDIDQWSGWVDLLIPPSSG